jgi:phosphoglycolate phosphatase-like HAD superfamily hydrolase
MHTALVLTPYGSKDIALAEPDVVLDRTADLAGLLDTMPDRTA